MSLIGVDLGTSGVRVVAVSAAGAEIAGAARATALIRPGPPGHVEIDTDEVLAAVHALLAQVAASPAVRADPPEALSFSVLGEAIVPVDADGLPLSRAPISMDRRGIPAARRISAELSADEIQRITGQPAHAMFSIYKLASDPAAWTAPEIRTYHCMGDYIARRLGARPAMDHSMAARTGAYDVDRAQWSAPILAAAGIPADRLPEVVEPGSVVGKLSAEAAGLTGLTAGLPIVVGSHDQASSYLGAGGRAGEISEVSFGSSDCLTIGTWQRPPSLVGTGLATYPMGSAGWVTMAGTAAGGWALDWFSQLVGVTDPAERDAMFEDAAAAEPSSVMVLPFLAGSGTLDNDPGARGAIVGLTLSTPRGELARAFLEAFGYEIRKIADALAAQGIPLGTVHAVGGGAKSMRSLGVRASAAGLPLTAVPGHAAARGAALQAGAGIGRYRSLADLPAPHALPAATPDPRTAEWYTAQARRFAELYPALIPHDRSYSTTEENQ